MRRYRLADAAKDDLSDIHGYISQHNPVAASQLQGRFFDTFGRLGRMPGMGTTMPELGRGDLRAFPVGNYVVFYRPLPNGVDIVRVVHGARDFESLF